MNTPKLHSLISSTLGNTGTARSGRAADPVQGLDFSQLLGERRSQAGASVANVGRGNGNAAANSGSRADTPQRASRTQESSSQRNEAPAKRTQGDPANRNSASRDASAPARATDNGQPSGGAGGSASVASNGNARENPAEAGGNTQAAAKTGTQAAAGANNTANAGASNQAAATPASHESNTLLAEQAAEAGLAAMMAGQGLPATVSADAGTVGAHANTAAVPGLPVATAGFAAGHAAGDTQLPATVPGDGTNTTAATDTANSNTAFRGANAARLAQANDAPSAAPVNGNATATLAAALAGTSIQDSDTTPVNPATLPPAPHTAALAAQANEASAAAMANSAAQVVPGTAGLADSAAARSLQDFTAMVQAARATSGTALPAAGAPQAAVPAPTLPGMAPAGLFGTQMLAHGAPGAPGIAAPLNSPQWPTEFGRQFISIAQAANGLGQVAELRLDPPELGPLRITINLNDNVAHAVISSPHAAVRQTVENALPQLQQMLEQAGISLGQANVNDQQPGNAFSGEGGNGSGHANASGESGESGDTAQLAERPANRPADPNQLVDTFA